MFVPYAVNDYDRYSAHMIKRFSSIGVSLAALHLQDDPVEGLAGADAIIVGGGNTFRLLRTLHRLELVEPVRRAVKAGVPYWGASAGSNVACPTIRTTNDMPIVEPASLWAFGLVPFQINPHYIDETQKEGETRETREVRIIEFLEENDAPVVALREGSWLISEGDNSVRLQGPGGGMLFRRGVRPKELDPGSDVSFLLRSQASFDTPLDRVAPLGC